MIRDNQTAATTAIFQLHRPFFDLNPIAEAPLSSQLPLLAYHNLDKEHAQGLQRYLTERFRFSLIAESGLHQYALLTPLEVPELYRTERWQRLCDLTEGFSDLCVSKQVTALYLLLALGFHRLILKLVPTNMTNNMCNEYASEVAYIRAFVLYRLSIDTCKRSYQTEELEEIVRMLPSLSHIRFQATMALLVHAAKVCKDVVATKHYRSILTPYVDATHHDKNSFAYYMLKSRFLRAASFEPLLERERERLAEEMTQAELLARNAPARTEEEHLIAKENLYSVLESRMREALWLGDLDTAQAQLEENICMNPHDSKTHIEMGALFLQRGNFAKAAAEYAQATHYSPPGSAPAYYMVGYCQERLGNLEQAIECYQASLRVDTDGISPIQGLLRTAKRLGKRPLFHWAEEKAIQLARAGHINQQELVSLA